MESIIYIRFTESETCTIGGFCTPNTDLWGFFLEPPIGSRIPAGVYEFYPHDGDQLRWNGMISIDVPGRQGILIHPGNYPKDTTGCLLPGIYWGVNAVYMSKDTMQKIILKTGRRGKIIILDPCIINKNMNILLKGIIKNKIKFDEILAISKMLYSNFNSTFKVPIDYNI